MNNNDVNQLQLLAENSRSTSLHHATATCYKLVKRLFSAKNFTHNNIDYNRKYTI